MTDSVPAPRIPYGAWPSPITAADVAKGQVAISYPMTIGTDVWWQEGRPDEGGRMTVVHCDAAGHQQALLPAPWNARTRVHEYGGRSYLPVPVRRREGSPAGQAVVFANYADQRLYLAAAAAPAAPAPAASVPAGPGPEPLTPPASDDGLGELRFADFILSADEQEVWCVQERHDGGKITRSLVAGPLDGSAAEDPAAIRGLVRAPLFFV